MFVVGGSEGFEQAYPRRGEWSDTTSIYTGPLFVGEKGGKNVACRSDMMAQASGVVGAALEAVPPCEAISEVDTAVLCGPVCTVRQARLRVRGGPAKTDLLVSHRRSCSKDMKTPTLTR